MTLRNEKKYRPIARTRAKDLHQQLKEAAAIGSSAHQLSLDFNDEEAEFVASLPQEDRPLYSAMYAQELNALTLTAATSEETARLEQKNIEMRTQQFTKMSSARLWIVPALLIFFFWLMYRA